VNRVWQAYFGTGLVETAEDLACAPRSPRTRSSWIGSRSSSAERLELQGAPPPHLRLRGLSPELEGDAGAPRARPAKPPFGPRPRFRVEAEGVRDIALSISGLLNEAIGGPSFFPPVPESLFA